MRKLAVLALALLVLCACGAPGGSGSAGEKAENAGQGQESAPGQGEAEGFDGAFRAAAEAAGGQVISLTTVPARDPEKTMAVATVLVKNEEAAAEALLSALGDFAAESGVESLVVSLGDMEKTGDAAGLLSAVVNADGSWEITNDSIDYNSERNLWIRGQFAEGSGAHEGLEQLLKAFFAGETPADNTPLEEGREGKAPAEKLFFGSVVGGERLKGADPATYKHVRTIYHDLKEASLCGEINRILEKNGCGARAEMGDIYIQTNFSVKTAAGKTEKHSAYGLARYADRSLELVMLE